MWELDSWSELPLCSRKTSSDCMSMSMSWSGRQAGLAALLMMLLVGSCGKARRSELMGVWYSEREDRHAFDVHLFVNRNLMSHGGLWSLG